MPSNQEKLDALHWNLIGSGRQAYEQSIADKAAEKAAAKVWGTRFADPNAPKETISAKDWLVYSNLKAGNAAALAGTMGQFRPEDIAAAIPEGIAETVAQLLAQRLSGETK